VLVEVFLEGVDVGLGRRVGAAQVLGVEVGLAKVSRHVGVAGQIVGGAGRLVVEVVVVEAVVAVVAVDVGAEVVEVVEEDRNPLGLFLLRLRPLIYLSIASQPNLYPHPFYGGRE